MSKNINGFNRIYVSPATYKRLAQAALKGGYMPESDKNRRNGLKRAVDALIEDALLSIEQYAEEIASHED